MLALLDVRDSRPDLGVRFLPHKLSELSWNVRWPVQVAVAHAKIGAGHPSWARLTVRALLLAHALPDYPAGQMQLVQIAPR